MTELPLRYLLMGPAKSGKTWQGATTPPPRLIVDLEGRARFTPQGQDAIFWDGGDDPMKLSKSKSRTFILETVDLAVLDMALQWLRSGKHPFKSLTIDSVMELRYLVIQNMKPGVLDIPRHEWGPINKKFEDLLRGFRDLTSKPGPVRCVMFITGATMEIESGQIKPIVKGEIGKLVPYWMDLVGYQEKIVSKGTTTARRELHLTQRPSNDLADVGDGTNRIITKLGSPLFDATVEHLFNALQDTEGDESG